MTRKNSLDIRKLTYLAMLTALVIVLQLVIAPIIGSATGLSPALVLVPFVLGVSICGIASGAWLGAVFSFIVVFDPTTVPFLEHNPIMTVVLVFAKGIGAAVIAGLVFKLLQKKNSYLAIFLAALAAPIANTGIFATGCLLFFRGLTGIRVYKLFITANFLIETVVNVILVPAVYHLLVIKQHALKK